MQRRPIVVVGSINIDLVVRVDRLPMPGETLLGGDFQSHPGGKGANQAAAVARLGHPVSMIGRVGRDSFGEELRGHLNRAGVDTSFVRSTEGSSGTANIAVTRDGQNSIIVAPGANALLTAEDLDANVELIRRASLVLAQLEIPMATIERLAELCARENVPLILDPAPAQFLSRSLLEKVAWITPNEVEAAQLEDFGLELTPGEIAAKLLALGPHNVIVKLGERGSFVATADGVRATVAGCEVRAVDTTGAGDAFNGAFAVGLARGMTSVEAAQFASAAAAISVTRQGALPSMPTQAEVDAFIEARTHAQQEFVL